MKYTLSMLVAILCCNIAIAQQYKNALQIPDLKKRDLSGKIKKIIGCSYDAHIVSDRPIKTKLTGINIDSFDKEGYIIASRDSLSDRRSIYYYNSNHEYISSEDFIKGKSQYKSKTRLLTTNKFTIETYYYSDLKHNYSTKPDESDTLVFEGNLQTSSSGALGTNLIEYVGRDTTITSIFNGANIFTSVVLERDAHGNATKVFTIPEVDANGVTSGLTFYTYEYY